MYSKVIAAFTAVLIFTFVADAHADRPTAAGSTEGVCDVLSEATPSLESLCVNYCEARDCVNWDDPECDNLLANYDRHRNDGDPEMPCLLTCPCFTADDLRNHPVEMTACWQTLDRSFSAITDDADTSGAGAHRRISSCLYSNLATDSLIIFLTITSEEVAMCIDMIDAEIADRGLTCRLLY